MRHTLPIIISCWIITKYDIILSLLLTCLSVHINLFLLHVMYCIFHAMCVVCCIYNIYKQKQAYWKNSLFQIIAMNVLMTAVKYPYLILLQTWKHHWITSILILIHGMILKKSMLLTRVKNKKRIFFGRCVETKRNTCTHVNTTSCSIYSIVTISKYYISNEHQPNEIQYLPLYHLTKWHVQVCVQMAGGDLVSKEW